MDLASLLDRARLRAERSQWRQAVRDLEILLEAQPGNAEALGLIGMCHYRLGRLDRAIGYWTKAAAADPGNKQNRAWLKEAKQLKRVKTGLRRIEQKLRTTRSNGQLYFQAGKLRSELRNWERASERFRAAVRLLPKDASVRKYYGLALFRLGKMSDAQREFEACVKLDPANAEYKGLLEQSRKLGEMHRSLKTPGAAGRRGHEPKALSGNGK